MKSPTMIALLVLGTAIFVAAQRCAPSCVNCVNDTVCLSCQEGYWNQHCLHICPENCDALGCDRTTGRCFACVEGYYGSRCSELCPMSCLRVGDELFEVGGACTASIAVNVTATNTNDTTGDITMDSSTSTVPESTTTGPRTPIPTFELRPRTQLQFNCTHGCARGFFGPQTGCRTRCESGCALTPDNRTLGGGSCVVDRDDQRIGICDHGCQYSYGGRTCSALCSFCDIPDDPAENSCNNASVCTNGCKVGHYGATCRETCSTSCSAAGCDQVTGKCLGCKLGGCGPLCTQMSGCQTAKCDTKPVDVTPLGADCGPCLPGQWGWLCEQRCPSNCLGPCDKLTGACLGECRGSYYGPKCDSSVPACVRAFPNGTCEHCERFNWGAKCNESCYLCEWPSDEVPEEVFTACERWTGECRFGCSSCEAGTIVLWTMLGIFVFFPMFMVLVVLGIMCAIRQCAASTEEKDAEKDVEIKRTEEKKPSSSSDTSPN